MYGKGFVGKAEVRAFWQEKAPDDWASGAFKFWLKIIIRGKVRVREAAKIGKNGRFGERV